MNIKSLLAVTVAVGAATLTATVADAATQKAPDAAFEAFQAENAQLGQLLATAKDAASRQAILVSALKGNPKNAAYVLQLVKAQVPTQALNAFNGLIAILSEDPANDDIVRRLTEENADLVAQANGDVEPAAGDDRNERRERGENRGNRGDRGNEHRGEHGRGDDSYENPGQISGNRGR